MIKIGKVLTLVIIGMFLTTMLTTSVSAGPWATSGNSISDGDFLGTTNAKPLIIKTNNNERMRITSTGDVGIGTAGPDRKLDVLNASGGPQLRLTYSDSSVYTDLQTTVSGHFYINPSGGNIGMGTASPRSKLDVSGANTQIGIIQQLIEPQSLTDVAPGGTVTVTGGTLYSGGPTYRGYHSRWNITAIGQELKVDLGQNVSEIKAITFGTYPRTDGNNTPSGYLINYSTNDTTYTTFRFIFGNLDVSPVHIAATPFTARYITITVYGFQIGQSQSTISGLQILQQGGSALSGSNNLWVLNPQSNDIILATSGNVGIGMTSPSEKLEVNGSIKLTGGDKWVGLSSTQGIYIKSDGNVGIGQASPSEKLEVSGNIKLTGGDKWVGLSSTQGIYIKSDGNVGIGTVPSEKLDVLGNIHASGKVSASAFASNSPWIAEAPIGTERARIDDITGNFGIGTTSPQEKLTLLPVSNFAIEMVPGAQPSGTPYTTGGNMDAGRYYYVITSTDGVGETIKGTESFAIILGGSGNGRIMLDWLTTIGAVSYNVYRTTDSGTYNDPCLVGTPTDSYFTDTRKNPIGGAPPLVTDAYNKKISASGISWFLGNWIGIGTSQPETTLTVKGNVQTIGGGAFVAGHPSTGGTTYGYNFIELLSGDEFRIDDEEDYNFMYFSNGDQNNNKIGIGGISSTSKLTIFSTEDINALKLLGPYGGANFYGARLDFGTDSVYLQEDEYGKLYIHAYRIAIEGGDVGINTKTPVARLEVLDPLKPQLRLTYSKDPDPDVYTDLKTTLAGELYINPTGSNVGIGVDDPSEALDIAGNLQIGGSLGQGIKFGGLYNNKNLILTQYDSGNDVDVVRFYTPGNDNSNEIMRIRSDYNVGIGTTNPTASLHLNPTKTTNDDYYGIRAEMTYDPLFDPKDMNKWYGVYIDAPNILDGSITNKYALVTEAGAGNVGIGTTGPTSNAKLHLRDDSGDNAIAFSDDSDTPEFILGVDAGDSKFKIHSGSVLADTSDFTITSDGKVGLGQSSPSQRLEVNGNIKLTDGNKWVGLSSTQGIYIDNLGRIGIGTTTPNSNAKLTVVGTTDYDYAGYFSAPVSEVTQVIHAETTGTNSQDDIAIYGKCHPVDYWGIGVQGEGGYKGVEGISSGSTTGGIYGVYGKASNSGSGNEYGVYGYAQESGTGNAYGVYSEGDFGGSGAKCAIVNTSQGPTLLYAQESPENWFEDFGEGELMNGSVHIDLDKLFLETVTINGTYPMKVFIQVEGNCNGVYVSKGTTGFDVIELNNGTSNVSFSYRIVAKRKGYEDKRLDYCAAAENDSFLYPEKSENGK